ncbi:MAG: chromosomal replication initiator protein DnaA [Candidatus Omnitrophica bacterium]|nr:chromosomal replication initiator protein DnaA [Candidatus Omnitrophota bacterium]MBU1808360.1 chromosomal replication initiator protein DnaA [Candidatus Omnitrophota bacterium]
MSESGVAIWAKALEVIGKELDNEQTINIWFNPIKCSSCTSEKMVLEVPNKFFQDWLLNRYMDILNSGVRTACGADLKIEFVLAEAASSPAHGAGETVKKEEAKKEAKGFWPFSKQAPIHARELGLDPKYTFDSFVVGSSNRFAHAAAMAVSDSPAKAYNPLFIYGGTGLGKTHLMHAIGDRVLAKAPKTKVLYISSEDFTNQMISAIQNRSMIKFREKYRNVDILLIDDVHFIAGKDSTQEEFFHTFNTLYDAHKQIVVTSDRPPKEINKLEERLVSRFLYGLVTDVQPPDFETRIAILKRKSEMASITLPEDVFYFLAEKVKTNIRELEGALIRVVAYSKLIGKDVSVDLVKEVLKDMIIEGEKKITIDLIQKKVSEYFDIKLSDMRAKKRSKAIAYPRQIAMYLTRQLTDYSLPEIGDQFGGRDHTTVIHACSKIEADLKEKDGFKVLLGRLIDSIKG